MAPRNLEEFQDVWRHVQDKTGFRLMDWKSRSLVNGETKLADLLSRQANRDAKLFFNGDRGRMSVTIYQDTLVEIEIHTNNSTEGAKPISVVQIINRTSIAHSKRTGHPCWWNPSNTLSPNCECILGDFDKDLPGFPVSGHELTVLPALQHKIAEQEKAWRTTAPEALAMQLELEALRKQLQKRQEQEGVTGTSAKRRRVEVIRTRSSE